LIQELKSFQFSLEEIHKLLTLRRLTSLSSVDDVNFFIQMLENKQVELQEEIQQINTICHEIDRKITDVLAKTKCQNTPSNGVSFTLLSILYCPTCQSSLELSNVKTKEQQIFMGEVYCPHCDYKARIEEGIMITEHLSEKAFNPFYIYDIEMFKKISSSFVNLSEKASMYVKQRLLNEDLKGKVIIETNIDTYVFLDKYLSALKDEAYYIFTGSTLPMLKMLKHKIESIHPTLPVLYILNSGMNLPLKHGSVDYFIDSYSFNEFALFHNKLPMSMLAPYLNKDATVMGCYFQYHHRAKTLIEMQKLHPDGYPNNLRAEFLADNLSFAHFSFSDKKLIGEIKDPGQYIKYHVHGELASYYVYQANIAH